MGRSSMPWALLSITFWRSDVPSRHSSSLQLSPHSGWFHPAPWRRVTEVPRPMRVCAPDCKSWETCGTSRHVVHTGSAGLGAFTPLTVLDLSACLHKALGRSWHTIAGWALNLDPWRTPAHPRPGACQHWAGGSNIGRGPRWGTPAGTQPAIAPTGARATAS